HGGEGRPRVEPDVEDVGLLLEFGAAALRAARLRCEQIARGAVEPCVRAFLVKDARDVVHRLGRDEGLVIPGAVEDGDRNAPRPLSRDAPVRTSLHHAADALPAPGWNPAALRVDLVDGRERRLADGGVATAREIDLDVEADPPLIGGAEDHRVLAAPAVRVAVADLPRPAPRVEQDSSAREQLDDLRVRVEHLETLES